MQNADVTSPVEEATDIDAGVANFFGLCAAADVVAVNIDDAKSGCGWTTPVNAERTNATLQGKFDDWVGAQPTAANRGRVVGANGSTLSAVQSYQIRDLVWQCLKDPAYFIKLSQILQYWYDNPGMIKSLSSGKINDYDIPQPSASTTTNSASATATATDSESTSSVDSETATTTDSESTTSTAPNVKRTVSPTGIADANGDFNPGTTFKGNNVLTGITCVDNQYRPESLDGTKYKGFLDQYNSKTKYAGEMSVQIFYSCAPWITVSKFPWDNTDRFANIETETPILFVQTTYDPVTPAISGQSASKAFTNSYYIESNGAGVSVIIISVFVDADSLNSTAVLITNLKHSSSRLINTGSPKQSLRRHILALISQIPS